MDEKREQEHIKKEPQYLDHRHVHKPNIKSQ